MLVLRERDWTLPNATIDGNGEGLAEGTGATISDGGRRDGQAQGLRWEARFPFSGKLPGRMLTNSRSARAIARDRVISSARPHSRTMNKVVMFRPTAAQRHSIREGFPRAGDEEVAPDAPCLRDHPVSGVPIVREYDTVFQHPAKAIRDRCSAPARSVPSGLTMAAARGQFLELGSKTIWGSQPSSRCFLRSS